MSRVHIVAAALLIAAPSVGHLPAQSPPPRTAALVWQVDGTEDGDPFGDLRDYVMLNDGTVWALDFKDQRIRRYGADGRPLAPVGRKGSGPGELRNANGMAVSPDGSVWVNDPANGRLSIYSSAGVPRRAITLPIGGYGYRWEAWFEANGELVDRELGREARYRRLSRDGTVLGTIPYPSCRGTGPGLRGFQAETKGKGQLMSAYPFTRGGGVTGDRNGHFWCASALGTRVARLPHGRSDTVARTSLEIAPVPVSREERDDAIRTVEARIAQYATSDFDRGKVPDTKPGIAELYVDHDTRLWVVHTAPWKRTSTTYDVFDRSGKALFRLTLPVRAVPHLPVVARGNDVVIAVYDEDDVVSLARYRLR